MARETSKLPVERAALHDAGILVSIHVLCANHLALDITAGVNALCDLVPALVVEKDPVDTHVPHVGCRNKPWWQGQEGRSPVLVDTEGMGAKTTRPSRSQWPMLSGSEVVPGRPRPPPVVCKGDRPTELNKVGRDGADCQPLQDREHPYASCAPGYRGQ